jgi:hypothetical protein
MEAWPIDAYGFYLYFIQQKSTKSINHKTQSHHLTPKDATMVK